MGHFPPLELWTILILQSIQLRTLDQVRVSMLRSEGICYGSPPIYETCDTVLYQDIGTLTCRPLTGL
jgi:hypothetical protein